MFSTVILAFGLVLGAEEQVGAGFSRDEAEEFLRTAEVVDRKRLSVGVTMSHRVTLSDGRRTAAAVWKTIDEMVPLKRFHDGGLPVMGFRDTYKSEVAAYELDKLLSLDMVPPTVERRLGGRRGSLQLWIDDCMTEATRRKRGIAPPDGSDWGRQVYRYRVFHQLIHDIDYQNLSNLLIDPEFDLWVVDQSRAFMTQGRLLEKAYLRRFSSSLLVRLRVLNRAQLDARLGSWLTARQIEALLVRRDLIVEHAEALIAEAGESAILY